MKKTILAAAATISLLTAAPAGADGHIDDAEWTYINAYAPAICAVIDAVPTPGGVLGVGQGIINDGFSADNAVDIINAAVWGLCPRHWALLEATGRAIRNANAPVSLA